MFKIYGGGKSIIIASLSLFCLAIGPLAAASWTPLTNAAPGSAGTMIQLTDGTVMVLNASTNKDWMRLTPDASGNYANGVWTLHPINPMSIGRLYFASQVLPSGKVWVLGGEYTGANSDRTDTNTGEIYDPVNNSWSPITSYPNQAGCGEATVTSNSAHVTSGSNIITAIEFTAPIQVGWTVAGTGIPNGATVTSVDSTSQVHISATATVTANEKVSFTGERVGCFGAVPSILLSGGKILAGSLLNTSTYLYNTGTDMWTLAANKVYDQSDEEGWVKQPNATILTYDIFKSIAANSGYSEVYDPVGNIWASKSPGDGSALGTLPVLSSDALGAELGPVIRLLDGRNLVIGANNATALYNPTNNTWSAGPNIFGTLNGNQAAFGADDAPAAILPNGHVIFAADAGPASVTSSGNTTSGSTIITNIPSTALFQVGWSVTDTGSGAIAANTTIDSIDSPSQIHISNAALATVIGGGLKFGGTFSSPTQLFDFNPAGGGSISPVSPALSDPILTSSAAFVMRMLMLPTGQLLFGDSTNRLYIYTPDGVPSPVYRPVVNSITYNGGGVFTLTGKQLNGQSAGASYGDDVQMDENYPILRLTNTAGNVYYCRTTNWSLTGVATGTTTVETVNFTLNPSLPAGNYSAVVSGAGISSLPVAVTITQGQVSGQ